MVGINFPQATAFPVLFYDFQLPMTFFTCAILHKEPPSLSSVSEDLDTQMLLTLIPQDSRAHPFQATVWREKRKDEQRVEKKGMERKTVWDKEECITRKMTERVLKSSLLPR